LYILEESKIPYKSDGDLIKLYKEVYKVLKMDPATYQENCFKQILSGIISIVNGLSNLRNVMSDAHGKSKSKYYKPSDRHAILAVNVARIISEFLYACWKSRREE
ncbi:MAG: abortive infection family protein, partial [Candidatus Zixiibacteriota bacterium]